MNWSCKAGRIPKPSSGDAGWLTFWVLLCAYLNLSGWLLSAMQLLNRPSYAVVFLAGAGLWVWWRRSAGLPVLPELQIRKLRRRFRRPLPLAFAVLTLMTLLGGVLHAPGNYDALAYRIPRILHWLAEEGWHWIPTEFNRLNTRGCGMEWVSAPVILFSKTDRWLFVINACSFLLLPGLFYRLLYHLGVRRRVARHWMWLLPTGYCYLLQAASVGNDLFGATFALAALVFALRSRVSRDIRDVWLSILAISVMTATKASNLPLVLPWLVVMLPTWRVWGVRPVLTALICLGALAGSYLPTGLMNWRYGGHWSGAQAERLDLSEGRFWHAKRNAIIVTARHLLPPVFPIAKEFNQRVLSGEPGLAVGELEAEEGAGLGSGVTLFLLVTAGISIIAAGSKLRRASPSAGQRLGWMVFGAGMIGIGVILSSLWVNSMARLLTPYYAMVVAPLLFPPAQSLVMKRWWWRLGVTLVLLAALALVILNPARPLWLPQHTLPALRKLGLPERLATRAESVYRVYGERANAFNSVVAQLPADAKVLGMVTFDQPEAALWRPFGERRIVHVRRTDTAESLRDRGVRYVLAGEDTPMQAFDQPLEDWVERLNARLVRSFTITLRVQKGPETWYLFDLAADGPQR